MSDLVQQRNGTPSRPRDLDLDECEIRDLARLAGGYTLPWVFTCDEQGLIYAQWGSYPVRPKPRGTLNHPIARGPDGLLYTMHVPAKYMKREDVSHALRWWGAERVYLIDQFAPGALGVQPPRGLLRAGESHD